MTAIGLDGFRRGWVAVWSDGSTNGLMFLENIAELLKFPHKIAMIDIPICLPEGGYRTCDLEAKQPMMQLTEATKQQAIATMTAAIIAASGRPHSIQQALDIARDIHFAMFPVPNSGAYQDWAKTKDARLNKVHDAS